MLKTVNCVVATESGFYFPPRQSNIPDNITDKIISYEEGKLKTDQIAELFQILIDTGLAWAFQGKYEQLALQLIEAGICHSTK